MYWLISLYCIEILQRSKQKGLPFTCVCSVAFKCLIGPNICTTWTITFSFGRQASTATKRSNSYYTCGLFYSNCIITLFDYSHNSNNWVIQHLSWRYIASTILLWKTMKVILVILRQLQKNIIFTSDYFTNHKGLLTMQFQ